MLSLTCQNFSDGLCEMPPHGDSGEGKSEIFDLIGPGWVDTRIYLANLKVSIHGHLLEWDYPDISNRI